MPLLRPKSDPRAGRCHRCGPRTQPVVSRAVLTLPAPDATAVTGRKTPIGRLESGNEPTISVQFASLVGSDYIGRDHSSSDAVVHPALS